MNNNGDLYNRIDFTNKATLKQLLYSRAQFESTGYASRGSVFDRNEPSNNLYTEIMVMYMDLDALIGKSGLTDKNMRLLNLVMNGYTISYIYKNFENYEKKSTSQMFNRTLEKIIITYKKEGGKNNDN